MRSMAFSLLLRGRMARWAVAITVASLAGGVTPSAVAADRYAAARNHLVDTQIVTAGIDNPRVIAAIRTTPRHLFIPTSQRKHAYLDMALPIGGGQTISPPLVVAMMTAKLDPQPTDKVLEIGTGSGYQAAVLSPLVADVYTIEIVAHTRPQGGPRPSSSSAIAMSTHGSATASRDGRRRRRSTRSSSPARPEDVPRPLVEQLAEGGRMIVPVGERFQQTLCLLTKTDGRMERETLEPTFFVPMTGQAERDREVLPDPSRPHLVHGSFEETIASTDKPAGWYYIRQGRVEEDATAPLGAAVVGVLQFDPRPPHARHAGVRGRRANRSTPERRIVGPRRWSGPWPVGRPASWGLSAVLRQESSSGRLLRAGPVAGHFRLDS